MRTSLILGCLLAATACSRTPEAKKEASATAAIRSKDEICSLLTVEEVAAEVKQPVTPRILPRAGERGAPECGWLTSEAKDATGFVLTLFFHPESKDGPGKFTEKIKQVCTDQAKKLDGLGDEAALCRKLLVRKGNVFFAVYRQGGDAAEPWQDAAQRLAQKVVSRLP